MAEVAKSSLLCESTVSARTAIDYELAGRLPSQIFQDLRSPSKARRRHNINLKKYYYHDGVSPSLAGRAHHNNVINVLSQGALSPEPPLRTTTKQELSYEAERSHRPPNIRRRLIDYARRPKPCREDTQRRARKHAHERLVDGMVEAGEPLLMSYILGSGPREDLDDHIFRRCEYCWPELSPCYVLNEMHDSECNPVGPWTEAWELEIGDFQAGSKFGFAGRAKVGALFLMTENDFRNWPSEPSSEVSDFEDEAPIWDDPVEKDGDDLPVGATDLVPQAGLEADASDVWSWDDIFPPKDAVADEEGGWEVLSSLSSWSCVSV